MYVCILLELRPSEGTFSALRPIICGERNDADIDWRTHREMHQIAVRVVGIPVPLLIVVVSSDCMFFFGKSGVSLHVVLRLWVLAFCGSVRISGVSCNIFFTSHPTFLNSRSKAARDM
jgi:hypothetical protein